MTNPRTQRVRTACEDLLAAGRDVTFTAVADNSQISRATCYRDRELRAIIETYRSRHGDTLTLTSLADQIDNLTQALEVLADRVRRQDEELRTLKRPTSPPRESSKNTRTPDTQDPD